MKRYDIKCFGPHMNIPGGLIAEVGSGKYKHRFGGDHWPVIDNEKRGNGPALLLTLDLTDPKLASLHMAGLDELPLCSYLNCIGIGIQNYYINTQEHRVILIKKEIDELEILEQSYALPNPLPEKDLVLREMKATENPVHEEVYWNCCDDFLGGKGVIRILGAPIWLQMVEDYECECDKPMEYVCSIGYEVNNNYRQLLDKEPFFPGEMAHYFFFVNHVVE